MDRDSSRPMVIVTSVMLVLIVALGLVLRLQDPLRGVLPAEDPYTHVVFTKEAIARGWFGDSVYLGTTMYPPGLHAFAGIVAPLSGVRLYDLALFAPVVLGGLAIVGMYALGARLGGAITGLCAAFLTAVMPEHIFRTNLFAPTAFDLALLPAWLLLFVIAIDADAPHAARAGAGVGLLALAVPLAFLHPWAVPLFAAPALGHAWLRAARTAPSPRSAFRAALVASALAVPAAAFAVATRWDASETGFAGFAAKLPWGGALAGLSVPVTVLFVVLLLGLGAVALVGCALTALARMGIQRAPRLARRIVGVALGVIAVYAALRLGRGDLPLDVDHVVQLQFASVALALIGLGLAFAAPTRAGDMGLALCAVLYPLTVLDVFHSSFWPQRTVVYLAVGVAILAASGVAWAFDQALAWRRVGRASRFVAPVAVMAAVLLVAGAVQARPSSQYEWYRLYAPDQFEGFQRTADALSHDPAAKAIVYSWQPALMIKTFARLDQARYSQDFFKDAGTRARVLSEAPGHAKYVVVDPYTEAAARKGTIDLSFLDDTSRYHVVYRTVASGTGELILYQVNGA